MKDKFDIMHVVRDFARNCLYLTAGEVAEKIFFALRDLGIEAIAVDGDIVSVCRKDLTFIRSKTGAWRVVEI